MPPNKIVATLKKKLIYITLLISLLWIWVQVNNYYYKHFADQMDKAVLFILSMVIRDSDIGQTYFHSLQ